jgi:DNA-binding CsgD family transcriptional regulator
MVTLTTDARLVGLDQPCLIGTDQARLVDANSESQRTPGGAQAPGRSRDQAKGSPTPDRVLLDAFVASRSRHRGPVVVLSERTMITNASAAELIQPADRLRLWNLAGGVQADRARRVTDLQLSNGMCVKARYQPIREGDTFVGVIFRLSLVRTRPGCDRTSGGGRSYQTLMQGWSDLTDAERTVAELVAAGLTNRETGKRMHSSPYTVDYHLRQIYRKLTISSRVELARLLGEHREAITAAGQEPARELASLTG